MNDRLCFRATDIATLLRHAVYLCRVALIMVLRKALGFVGLAGAPSIVALWALVLGLSVLLVSAAQRVLPRGVRALVLGAGS